MFTRYNLVQFDNNTYGVLKTTCGLFKSFVDMKTPDLCWRMDHRHFDDCKTSSKQRALAVFKQKNTVKPKYTIIKDSLDE
jgi:hypothetical protein